MATITEAPALDAVDTQPVEEKAKAQPTDYIVLRADEDSENLYAVGVGPNGKPQVYTTHGPDAAIKAAVAALPEEDRNGVYAAVPKRSWRPKRYGLKIEKRESLEEV